MRATVVGAGVSGLTTASTLLDAGWDVDIVARETYQSAVSLVAGAVWTTTSAEPAVRARQWATASWDRFDQLAMDGGCGVNRLRQLEYERTEPGPNPWENTRFCRRLEADELPAGYQTGFEVDGFIIEPPIYLQWLQEQVVDAGATMTMQAVEQLADLEADVVVNCAGLGGGQLGDDDTMYPIRGQVVVVAKAGVDAARSDESDIDRIAYIYPRSEETVLGGVRQAGNSATEPDDATTARILADCAVLDPRVADLDVLEVRVGLRPGRPSVRVEREALPDGRPLLHNYGHSGAGFILSWGCAADVLALL